MPSFSLKDCGHTFCIGCIILILRGNLRDHIEHTLRSTCPNVNDEVMTEHQIIWVERCICDMILHQLPLPGYKCPKCHSDISSKPIAAFLVQELLDKGLSQELMSGVVRPTCGQRIPADIDIDVALDAFFATGH